MTEVRDEEKAAKILMGESSWPVYSSIQLVALRNRPRRCLSRKWKTFKKKLAQYKPWQVVNWKHEDPELAEEAIR